MKDLRSKNFQGTDQELEQSLTAVLRQFADNTVAASTPGLETTASIRGSGGEGQQIVITLRKRIDSITVRKTNPVQITGSARELTTRSPATNRIHHP